MQRRSATRSSKRKTPDTISTEFDDDDDDADSSSPPPSPSSPSSPAPGLSYEQLRKRNIARNLEKMRLLRLGASAGKVREALSSEPSAEEQAANEARRRKRREEAVKRRKKAKEERKQQPVRRSLRTRGLAPDGNKAEKRVDPMEQLRLARAEREKRRTGELRMELDDEEEGGEVGREYARGLLSGWDVAETQWPQVRAGVRHRVRHEKGFKCNPGRIYSMAFLPLSGGRRVVAVGDKSGTVAMYDVDKEAVEDAKVVAMDAEGDMEMADEQVRVVFPYRPHRRPVSAICVSHFHPQQVHTSSYEGTVRCLDLHAMTIREVFSTESERDGLTALAAVPKRASNIFYASTSFGSVYQIDERRPHRTQEYVLHDKKTACVHVNPARPELLVTASNDTTVCLWDARKLKGSLNVLPHGRGVTGAYFSPDGQHLVTTSYDNLLRVWDATPWAGALKPVAKVPSPAQVKHDNHTGRWVTPFRAQWMNNNTFMIGNMKRKLDVFEVDSSSGSKVAVEQTLALEHENVTSIPAVNCVHPTIEGLFASGSASGRVYVWEPIEG